VPAPAPLVNFVRYQVSRLENGAPGENRTPNLMVRSHALYPIELRAHRGGGIASLNYNGNEIISPSVLAQSTGRDTAVCKLA
jgi:hypothetical protein